MFLFWKTFPYGLCHLGGEKKVTARLGFRFRKVTKVSAFVAIPSSRKWDSRSHAEGSFSIPGFSDEMWQTG